MGPTGLRGLERLVAIAIEVHDIADGTAGRRPVLPHRPAQRHDGTRGDTPRQSQHPAHQPGASEREGDQRRAETDSPRRQQQDVKRPAHAGHSPLSACT
jgi:hypothetical protein